MSARMLLSNNVNDAGNDTEFFIIDAKSRTITPPTSFKNFGVESDENANRVYFKCPRVVGNNLDLSTLNIRVNYQNAKGEKDQYIVDDVTTDGDTVYFSWVLSRKCTAYNGAIMFIVCAVSTDAEGTIKSEWNTTLSTGMVLAGLEVDAPEIPEDITDVVSQLLDIVNNSIKSVASAEAQALTEIAEAKTEAIEAVNNTPNTLYANAIKGSARGEAIRVNDVSPITHNVAVKVICPDDVNGESVTLSVCGKNLAYQNNFVLTGSVNTSNSIGGFGNTVLVKDIDIVKGMSYRVTMNLPIEVTKPRVFLYNGKLSALTHTSAYNELIPKKRGVEKNALDTLITNNEGYEHIAITTGTYATYELGAVTITVTNLQLELGDSVTEYESYNGLTTYTPDSDGNVTVESITPTMTLFTDTEGVNIECEYTRDSNSVITELVERISALEGGV